MPDGLEQRFTALMPVL